MTGRRSAATGPAGAQGDAFRKRYAERLGSRGRLVALDRLTALATRVLGAAAAQVSLVSEVQTVVGAAGLADTVVGVRTPAAEAVCALVAETGSVVRVDDASRDDRVAHLPSVASGAVGAYLGVPLVVGQTVVGALCVFEPMPRAWTADDESLLDSLGQSVSAELELVALEASYLDERTLWQLAVDAGEVGAFDWNLTTGELRWDQRLLELFGLDEDTFDGTIEAFNAAVHPDDRERVTQALNDAILSRGGYAAEYRIVRPDGEVRWIAARGRALADPDGGAVRVLGAASDTTAVQEQESRVARVLESMPTAFFSLDRDWRFTYANNEAQRLLGGIGREFVGGVIWEEFPAAIGSEFERQYRHSMETGEPVTFEAYYPPPLDAHYEVRAWPTPDGLSVYFLEITARRRAQTTLERTGRRSALLAEVAAEMANTWAADEAAAKLARLVLPELGDWCIVTLTDRAEVDPGQWRRGLRDAGWWHVDPDCRPLVERYAEVRLAALTDSSFFARALTGTGPVVVEQRAAEAVASVLEPGEARDLCVRLDPASAAMVALRARGRTLGVLTVFRGPASDRFDDDDLALLRELADRVGLGLDNARLHAEQRDLAEHLQRSMMTAPPEPDHLHVAVRYQPAGEVAQVGGDWYDAFLQPEGATVVVIGDVIGHDTAAAAAMGQIRNILRGVAVATRSSPAELLRQVDTVMAELLIEITATVVVARFEQTAQERRDGLTRMRWSNAGHPPPVVVTHPDGTDQPERTEVLWGGEANLLLGLKPDVDRDEATVVLPRGSTVLLYTDGLVERRGELIDAGVQRLADTFTALVDEGLPLEELCDELLRRMLPDKPDDDVALLAVRLHPEDRPRPAEAGPRRVPPGLPEPPE